MRNEKGVSAWVIILIIALVIGGAYLWSKHFAKPAATVMMQGADQAKPAIDKAEKAKSSMDNLTKSAEDVAKKASQGTE